MAVREQGRIDAGDLPLLCDAILARLGGRDRQPARSMRLSAAAIDRLRAHDFPGNVRELENVLERALALMNGEQIEAEDLQFESGLRHPGTHAGKPPQVAAIAQRTEVAGAVSIAHTVPQLPLHAR